MKPDILLECEIAVGEQSGTDDHEEVEEELAHKDPVRKSSMADMGVPPEAPEAPVSRPRSVSVAGYYSHPHPEAFYFFNPSRPPTSETIDVAASLITKVSMNFTATTVPPMSIPPMNIPPMNMYPMNMHPMNMHPVNMHAMNMQAMNMHPMNIHPMNIPAVKRKAPHPEDPGGFSDHVGNHNKRPKTIHAEYSDSSSSSEDRPDGNGVTDSRQ